MTAGTASSDPRALLLLIAAAALCVAPALAAEPGDLLQSIRSTVLDPARAVAVSNLELEVGIAVLSVRQGVLIPTRPIDGRTVELVFIGDARFRCDPPDAIEAAQLELFTGRSSLDAPVEGAVLVVADQDTVNRLLLRAGEEPIEPELIRRALAFHRGWLKKTERRLYGLEPAIFRALLGDAAFRGYFALWCRSSEVGDFVYQLDPEDVEQLTIASFVRRDMSGWSKKRVQRNLRIQQRKGRWLGVRLEDIGAWDVWLSASWTPDGGDPAPGSVGFETERYELDVTIQRRSLELEAVARLELLAQADGRKAVPLELFRDLRVRGVTDGQGRELFFFRSGREVLVCLPEPSRSGEKLTLEVTYGGHALKWVGGWTFDLEDTNAWYPRCGTVDRAVYDVTLRWPRRFGLIAGGRRVEGGRQGRFRWERRVLDTPSIAFSFAVGKFQIERFRSGAIDVTMAFDRSVPWRLTQSLRQRVVDAVDSSLRFYQETFGPLPYRQVSLVTLPRDYSQSYPGFITLTNSVARPGPTHGSEGLAWVRDTTIAHEIAHQWWGNLLGWWNYRDQWLSEAMANYSALVFHAREDGDGKASLSELSGGWRDSLNLKTLDGRTIESLGPVVLGRRLNSSLATNGYRAIVYRKGAVVLAMLARTIGEERFLEMLHALVDAAAHRVISTEDFLRSLERMSGVELDGFAEQFIFGTGIPSVYYDYEASPSDAGGWVLSGEAHRLAELRHETRLVRDETGRWDVQRENEARLGPESAAMMVPFRVTLAQDSAQAPHVARAGQLLMTGSRENFSLDMDREPVEMTFDPGGELLAYFYSAREEPKQVRFFRARNLLAQGLPVEAEAEFRAALELPVPEQRPVQPVPWIYDPGREATRSDVEIRLALARLYLDQDREDEARHELSIIDEQLDPTRDFFPVERDALAARLEVRNGQYDSAYKRLRKVLRVVSSKRQDRRAFLRRVRLGAERPALTDIFALFAVAARETGHDDELRWAREEAQLRGVDLAALSN